MRVLVTGGAGFIASHIVDRYLELGHTVSVVDDLSTGRRRNINPKALFYEVDIRDFDAVDDVFKREKPDVVNHHAAQIDVRLSVTDPCFDADVNIIGSVNLLEAMVKHGVRRMIYASTGGAVYGNPQHLPVTEQHPVNPISQYGISKHTVEHYLCLYSHNYGIEYVSLRYSNIFGPRQDPNRKAGVVAIFAALMLKGEVPVIYGDGESIRDYLYVDDVVDANVEALKRGTNCCLNIGSGEGTSVNEIFEELAEITGFDRRAIHRAERKGEVRRIYLDATLAGELLGWSPKTTLKEGLRLTVEHLRKEVGL